MIKNYQKRRIFYVQGYCLILALVMISSLFVYNLLIKEKCISVFYLEQDLNLHPHSYFYPYMDSLPAKRDYKIIEIQPKSDSIYKNLDKFIRPIENNKDTLKGVKIIFSKNIKYGQYIETINSLLKIGVKTYVPYGDTIFVYYLTRYNPDDILESNIPWKKVVFLIE